MRDLFLNAKMIIKKYKWWTALISVIVFISAFVLFSGKKNNETKDIVVEKRNIIEEVSVTGNVKAISDLDLSFESSGQVSTVLVSVGDKVDQGQYLASLSNADLVASLEQAKAGLKIAEANLSALINGSTNEEIAVNESQVEKAKSDLLNEQTDLINSIRDAYTKSDDAIRYYVDPMFDAPRTTNPSLLFQTDSELQIKIIDSRIAIEKLLSTLNSSVININSSNVDSVFGLANNTLLNIQMFLRDLAFAVNKLNPTPLINQTTINTWKTNISTSRSNIDLSMSALTSAKNQYESASATLKISTSQLNLIKAGATADELDVQKATVEQAKANVDAAKAKLSKSIIVSPISGVITKVDAKIGQIMQAGVIAISVISYGQYEVESFVPEADIAKVKIGDKARTTLDAYGSDILFETEVVKIDPGETVIENVPTYKVTLKFASSTDSRIKSGMTANLDILTGQKKNVIAVPSRSVYSVGFEKFVKLIDGINPGTTKEVNVETGMRGVDGYIEIISGLKEGDKILASPNM